jgi:hypothetical protein
MLALEGVPRELIHEAASALCAGGASQYALLAARTSEGVAEARAAYATQRQIDLRSATAILDEGVAALEAPGSERAKAETFVGLLLAAFRCGASGSELLEVLDAAWPRIDIAISGTAVVLLLRTLQGPLATDRRWSPRFIRFLADAEVEPVHGWILTVCARSLEQEHQFAELDRDRIATALCRISPAQLQPTDARLLLAACAHRIHPENALGYGPIVARAGALSLEWWATRDPVTCTALLSCQACAAVLPGAALEQLWHWAIERQRADVVRSILALRLPQAGEALRQRLIEELMAKLLREHRSSLLAEQGSEWCRHAQA